MGCYSSRPEEKIMVRQAQLKLTGWTHVAYSGGAANGIMYIGAYRALWESAIMPLQGAVGTSIGSLFAVITVLQIDPADIQSAVEKLDTSKLADNSWCAIDDVVKFLTHLGLFRGNYLEKWCEDIISRATKVKKCTFLQMYNITKSHLKISVCNETYATTEYWDHLTQPDMPVSFAIRASASMPFIYDPVPFADMVYIDGGIGDIYPLNAFGNKTTLGLLLLGPNERETREFVSKQKITNIYEHAQAVYTSMAAMQFRLQHTDDWPARTISLRGPGKPQWNTTLDDWEKTKWIEESYLQTVSEIKALKRTC